MFGMKDALNRFKTALSQDDTPTRCSSLSSSGSTGMPSKATQVNHTGTTLFDDDDLLPSVKLNGYLPTTKNRLLTPEMCDEMRSLMPTRIQLYTEWQLLYSLEQHGASLHSLYDNLITESKTPIRVGYVIVIKDRKQGIFGAYCNEAFHPTESRRYYGNGECFLWKMEKVPNVTIGEKEEKECDNEDHDHNWKWQFRGYPYTGLNEFAIYCRADFLSMGAGDGHYGLWIDDGLIHGVSNPSLTYGNDVLSREGKKFHIVALEVWRVG